MCERIASELRVDEPVLRESLRRAAAERRSEVKPKPELMGQTVKAADRRLMQMLVEADGFRARLAREISDAELHLGLETEKIFAVLVEAANSGSRPDPATLADALEERDRRLLFEILFEQTAEAGWEEAESCLAVLRQRRIETELAAVQKQIEGQPAAEELRRLLVRKQDLHKLLTELK